MLKVSVENMKFEIEEIKKEDRITSIKYSDKKTSPIFKVTSQT